ncbi:hypothetical protein SADUNF_Sadunf16G0120800 [Salix dunnii]|uniref:Uncharacterized protein n=1 Tax=Salix dunnii TaxID=1413687 RepID=A0A835MGR5_9ROSI|nr:hypothetical protein SADUNF_Sadunf16G0120800 [Salix dunnii]
MAQFSAIFSCFVPSSSSRVSNDNVSAPEIKAPVSEKSKGKSKSAGAPIVASYFPVNSYPSRLSPMPTTTIPSANLGPSIDNKRKQEMGHFTAIFSCFVPSASSRVTNEVTDEAHDNAEKPKSKSKSSGAPILVSYFPTNSYLSRL